MIVINEFVRYEVTEKIPPGDAPLVVTYNGDDPFDVDAHDADVVHMFAQAAKFRNRDFVFQTEHVFRMRRIISDVAILARVSLAVHGEVERVPWPLPNVWIGARLSFRKQMPRVVDLVMTPAKYRFVLLENTRESIPFDRFVEIPSFEPTGETIGGVLQTKEKFDRVINWAIVAGVYGVPLAEHIVNQCINTGTPLYVHSIEGTRNVVREAIPPAFNVRAMPAGIRGVAS